MRNFKYTMRSIKYYPRKKQEKPVVQVTEPIVESEPTVQVVEQKIEEPKTNPQNTLDDFEAEYQAFIASLKAKKEVESATYEETTESSYT